MEASQNRLGPAIAVLGAILAVGLTTYAGVRVGSPLVLRVLFAAWVFSPFAGLLIAWSVSVRWQTEVRAALHAVTLVVAGASAIAYAYFALGAARPTTAAFVAIAPLSWLVAMVVLGVTALTVRK